MCLNTEDMNNLVDRLEHPIRASDLTQELFDLPDLCIAECLLTDIARCVGVRIWLTRRQETNMKGEVETHRFFAVLGTQQDVDTAGWLFDRCETTVGENTAKFVNKYIFSLSDIKILKFQQDQITAIRRQLKTTIDYFHDAKEAVIEPAFASLNIKFTRKKTHDHSTTAKAYTRSVTFT